MIKIILLLQYRKVTLKKFHGQVMLDVREFYMNKLSQEIMPGILINNQG